MNFCKTPPSPPSEKDLARIRKLMSDNPRFPGETNEDWISRILSNNPRDISKQYKWVPNK